MSHIPKTMPNHVAIILDGNGRWAKKRGRPRHEGHRAGALNVRDIALTAADAGIGVLSVFAFSTENWQRPKDEVERLMSLPAELDTVLWDKLDAASIRVRFSGRRDRLARETLDVMDKLEKKTYAAERLTLNICLDYGSHDEWLQATKHLAAQVKAGTLSLETLDVSTLESALYTRGLPPVDFLIRTSGEQRLSNFLLFQSAYAELYFTRILWPDFKPNHFKRALKVYQKRTRKFGGVKG
ncbi:MAG: di-trans,poly-cis-decaprenylcistransferase [Acholeplasmatales bacterium]|nr:MAG: di-trans,poly-cis-decaprenylcistransferase [Acholeplasmatales bacterium]